MHTRASGYIYGVRIHITTYSQPFQDPGTAEQHAAPLMAIALNLHCMLVKEREKFGVRKNLLTDKLKFYRRNLKCS
jgi:hypothetical protein